MPEYIDAGLLGMIDDRVRRALSRPLRVATFQERTGTVNATVTEDGAAVTMPVLIGSSVRAFAGDRVVMAQFGSDWVVIETLVPRGVELQYEYTASGETVTSGSYVDAPGLPSLANRTFIKTSADTALIARIDATAFVASGTGTADLQWAVNVENIDTGDNYGPTLIASWLSADINRTPHGRQVKLTGIPAGTYDVVLQWRRAAGTGTITMNADDRYTFNIRETTLQP